MRTIPPTAAGLIMEGARRHSRALGRELEGLGLDQRGWAVLMALYELGTAHQQVVRDLLGVTKHAVLGLVDLLESESLLDRRSDPADRRVQLLELTARGHDLVSCTLLELTERVDERFLVALSDDERRHLRRLLTPIVYGVAAD